MNYASLEFLFFAFLLLIIYYLLPKKYGWIILLIGSVIFYYLFSFKYIVFIILSTFITYIFSILIDKHKKNKFLILVPLLINLLLLIVLKYNMFIPFFNISIKIFKFDISLDKLIMPIGISYYTLDMIGYITDIYRKKYPSERNYFKLLLYFMYFPKIVVGPFCRYNKISTGLFNPVEFNYEKFNKSLLLIGYGFIKKLIIADRLGIFVDIIFVNNYSGILLILAIIFFTIQLYTDFSGCIDIVRGISELFGIELPKNFQRPFLSKTIQEFWQRWHITLGEWLKEYVFFPISLSKINMKLNAKLRNWKQKHLSKFIMIAFPSFFVWLSTGLWHGISVKFIAYGLYYYLLMMLGVLLKPILNKIVIIFKVDVKSKLFIFFQILRTILIVCFGMFIFRCESFNQMSILLSRLFTKSSIDILSLGISLKDLLLAIGTFIIVMILEIISERKKIDFTEKINNQNISIRLGIYLIIIISIIVYGNLGGTNNGFIYENF